MDRTADARACRFGSSVRRYGGDSRLLALAVIAGAGAVYLCPAPPTPAWFALPLAFCLLRFPGRAIVVVFCLTAAWTSVDVQQRLDHRLPVARSGETVWVTGRVAGLASRDAMRTRFVLARDSAPYRLRLSWYDDAPVFLPGDCLRLRIKWQTPHGSANPGVFDYEAWLWREGIDATGYVKDAGRCASPPTWTLDRLRALALARLDRTLADSPMRGVIEALTLGARDGISDAQWDVLRASGTSHLVAISGLHVGLLAALLFFIARWLALRSPWRDQAQMSAAIAAFAGAALYACLAGLALPTQRALVMVGLALYMVATMREIAPSRMLAVAAMVVVITAPESVIAPGFWLSFGAVAWLLYIADRRPRSRLMTLGWLQLALIAGLMPVTLWFFEQASLIAPLANAVLVPMAGVFVPALLLLVLVALVWPALGAPLLQGAAWLMAFGWRGLEWLAGLPLADVHVTVPGLAALALALAGVALLLMPRGLPGRWAGLVLLAPALFGWRPAFTVIPTGGYRATVLDVGQGLSVVVRTRAHTLVFDAGPAYRTGFDTGESIVVPFLRHIGRPRVDRLVISHADLDHRGGAAAIVRELSVGRWVGAGGDLSCRAGMHWRWDGVDFRFLYPTSDERAAAQSSNERSCVLRVAGPGGRLLLTGDLEAAGEQELLARDPAAVAADVLVVAHHGSASSSSAAFVDAVAPAFALISAGWQNRWGFPAPAVVARLERAGAAIHDTASGGALDVRVPARPDAAIRVADWRARHRRLWHAR